MSTNRKLSKSKSFYSLRKIHNKNNKGTFFENDYLTISQNDDVFDYVPLYPNSNFKVKIDANNNSKRRHLKSPWILNGSAITWTKQALTTENKKNQDSKIILKPNYKSLKDFAYFGSAVELIRATVNDIIKRFPGGLCYYENAPEIKVDGKTYYLVSNECQIDCWSQNVESIPDNKNPLRYLSYSYKEYENKNGGDINSVTINITNNCIGSIIGTLNIDGVLLYIYINDNGQKCLLTEEKNNSGVIIKPKVKHFAEFWESLDDFERVLLNNNSIPLYTAVFDTTYFTDTGYYYTPKSYTWPTISNTMFLDLSTFRFESYINSLIDLASFHDEYDSDNMWRMMTHDSIKNLDETFKLNGDDELDFGRMQAITHIQGRQFDDIKRYIDAIKSVNSISYDEQNNVPDYFLTDLAENSGWETKNICNGDEVTDKDVVIKDEKDQILATIVTKGKTTGFVNSAFFRNLILNSDYLHSLKGTKCGIETMLNLFGFDVYGENPEVEIIEYYAEVKELLSFDDFVCKRGEFDNVYAEENMNYLIGYPLASYEYNVDKNTYNAPKIGPWYDPNEKYDNFYYQCNGGWGKTNNKYIDRPDITKIKNVTGNNFYKETESYLLFVDNLTELTNLYSDKIKDGSICYVSDISNIENVYISGSTEIGQMGIKNGADYNFSHYFILENATLSTCLGYVKNKNFNCYGWYNVKLSEYDGIKYSNPTEKGKIVLHLETLVTESKGNNPHTGKGEYDFGYDYLDKYRHLFREAIAYGLCDNLENYDEIKDFGFEIDVFDSNSGKTFSCFEETDMESSLKRINLKNLTIHFTKIYDNEYKKYIMDLIVPYLEAMIPSTMIVEYIFGDEDTYMSTIKDKLKGNNKNSRLLTPMPVDEITSEIDMWAENNTWQNN